MMPSNFYAHGEVNEGSLFIIVDSHVNQLRWTSFTKSEQYIAIISVFYGSVFAVWGLSKDQYAGCSDW